MEAYIERVAAVAPRMQEAIDTASKGLAKGVISHTFALEGVKQQTQKVISVNLSIQVAKPTVTCGPI